MNCIREIFVDLKSPKALPAISYGCVIGVLFVVIEVSFASMIFSGPLAAHATRAAGLTLFGAMAMTLITCVFSSFRVMVSLPQDTPVAILAGSAASIAVVVAALPPEAQYATVVALMALSALITAVFFAVVGGFRLSNLVRFLPFPVVGGFLAGSGALLASGGLGVMTGHSLSLDSLSLFLQWPLARFWLPGAVFAVLVLVVMKLRPHFMILPGSLVLGMIAFYCVLAATGTSALQAREAGWLLGELPAQGLWPAFGWEDVGQVQWSAVFGQLPDLLSVALLSLVGLLLNVGGIELGSRTDIDMDRELMAGAGGNVAMALGGGFAGYPTLSLSLLGPRTGVVSRLIPMTTALICAGVLFLGGEALTYFPKALLGGLVMLIGLFLLDDWIFTGWKRLTRLDYGIVVVITLTIAHVGFLEGVGLGLVLSVVLFLVRLSRVPVVTSERSGAEEGSAKHRPVTDRVLLRARGGDLRVFELHGFLFFGSASSLGNRVAALLQGATSPRFLAVDMAGLDGYDISAVNTFQRMAQQAQSKGVMLLLAAPPKGLHTLLARNAAPEAMAHVRRFDNAEAAMEWAEDQLLAEEHAALADHGDGALRRDALFTMAVDDVALHLEALERFEALAESMGAYLEHRELADGEELFHQGEDPQGTFMVLSGTLAVVARYGTEVDNRIRSLGPGSLAAPMAAIRTYVAPGTARAEGRTVVGYLSREALALLEEADPQTALAFHKLVARVLGRRAEGR